MFKDKKKLKTILIYVGAVLIYLGVIILAILYTIPNPDYNAILQYNDRLIKALWNTLFISVIALVISVVLGFIIFLLERSKIVFLKAMIKVFKEIVFGTPLLVMIFLVVFIFGHMIQVKNDLWLGILALSLYMSPYLANAFESASCVVDEEQYMVMDLYNFSKFDRYRHIILPQMVKPMIPAIISNLSAIIKGSALLNIVSIGEITYVINSIAQLNWANIEGYYVMWVMYLAITIPLSLVAKYLGKRLAK